MRIGHYNELAVGRLARPGAYLTDGETEVLLPGKYLPPGLAVGDSLTVFVYTDSEDRPVATTLRPAATVGEFASLTCVGVASFGAFLDWGLDKDLLVPRDCQLVPMRTSCRYVVYVTLDTVSQRVVGLAKLQRFLVERPAGLQRGQKVELLIWDRSELGFKAVVDGRFAGLLYHDQIRRRVAIGDRLPAYVKAVRDDGLTDLSLDPQGYDELLTLKPRLLDALRQADGFLPCNAKSDPDVIAERFGMSKKAFKKLVGALYKERLITLHDDGIRLADKE